MAEEQLEEPHLHSLLDLAVSNTEHESVSLSSTSQCPHSQSLCDTAEQGGNQTLAHKLHQLEMPHSTIQAASLPISSFSKLIVPSLTLAL